MDTVQVMTIEEQIAYSLEYEMTLGYTQGQIAMLIPLCKLAIEKVNQHEQDTWLDLPEGMGWTSHRTGIRHTTSPAYEVIRLFGLDKFLNSTWK